MSLSLDEQTIVAQCSPSGSGAIALIRLSGHDACHVAARMSELPRGSITTASSHTIQYGWVTNQVGKRIDEVLFLVMHAPRTFTGQDTVEITCHNNQFLIESIIERALQSGARIAENGEFSRRAFINGKIDLLKAEGINELIHAPNQQALKSSMAQLQGSFSSWVAEVEKQLLYCHAYCQASFEFLDEELEFAKTIAHQLGAIADKVNRLIHSFDSNQQIKNGIRIALLGSVNAGKSSLFNALLEKKRAIVSPQAGTTRDAIEGLFTLQGMLTTLIDTAGLRQTDDQIEAEGIERAWQEAAAADIILLVTDSSRSLTAHEHTLYNQILKAHEHKIITVATKIDCIKAQTDFPIDTPTVAISTQIPATITILKNTICDKIDVLFLKNDLPFLLNQRHLRCLKQLDHQITVMRQLVAQPSCAYEILAVQLEDALASLTELTGKTICEQSMDAIFKEFCVGK